MDTFFCPICVWIGGVPLHMHISISPYVISFLPHFLTSSLLPSGERWVVGVGDGVKEVDSLRRELVHKLFIAPLSHSQILKEFRVHYMTSNNDLVKLVCEVLS